LTFHAQIFANAQPYDHFGLDAVLPSVYCPPLPDRPFTSCFGSIAPVEQIRSNIDALGLPIAPVKLHVPPSGTNQSSVPPARHDHSFTRQTGSVSCNNNAVQLQTRRLLQSAMRSGTAQQNVSSKIQRKSAKNPGRSSLPGMEASLHDQSSKHCNGGALPKPSSSSSFNASTRPVKYGSRTCPTEDVAPSVPEVQVNHAESFASFNSCEYTWLEHWQRDPKMRSLPKRSEEDNNRIDAMSKKGGACGPCRRIKKRCDELDHCRGCVHRGILSEAKFLASLKPVSYTPDLEDISLHNLESLALSHNRSLASPDTATILGAQAQATNHVNAWFKNVTRMIDPKPFYNDMFEPLVSLDISSGFKKKLNTCFNLEYLDISSHLEVTAYQLDEESLLAGFVVHGGVQVPPTPRNGRLRSQCVNHLSGAVSNTFAFLRSFADAEIYASINNMSAARASISIVYASLYRLLLAKSDDLCFFILKSLRQDFHYCTRRSRKAIIKDSLRGVAQYHRVVAGLANLELMSSPEVAALFSDLKDHAKTLLRNGGIKSLFLRILAQTRPISAPPLHESSDTTFQELISSYASDLPEIKSLSIALRVNSGNHRLRPMSTELIRDSDPYHHYRPIKVRDLLKETEALVIDPKQVYVDDFLDNFNVLGRTRLDEAGPSVSCPSSFIGPKVMSGSRHLETEAPSTSLNPEHASLRTSQRDTEVRSIKSESTVQNDLDVDQTQPIKSLLKEGPAEQVWRDVPCGKRCKRRKRSRDSQHSRRASGQGHRKHTRLDSGRESPPPYNYYGPLTLEPDTLP
jgi:hypothetical protein